MAFHQYVDQSTFFYLHANKIAILQMVLGFEKEYEGLRKSSTHLECFVVVVRCLVRSDFELQSTTCQTRLEQREFEEILSGCLSATHLLVLDHPKYLIEFPSRA